MTRGWRGESKRHSLASRGISSGRQSQDHVMHSEPKILRQTEVPSLKNTEYEVVFDDYEHAKNFFKSLDNAKLYAYGSGYRVIYDRDKRMKSISKSRIVSRDNEFCPGKKTYHLVQPNGKIVMTTEGLPVITDSYVQARLAIRGAKRQVED